MNDHILEQNVKTEFFVNTPGMTLHQNARVNWLFTSRAGGVSTGRYDSLNLALHVGDDPRNVQENRLKLAQQIGIDAARIVWMDQIHTTNFGVITAQVAAVPSESRLNVGIYQGQICEYGSHENLIPQTDALITAERGIALAVLVADCVPVILYDADTNIIMAVHAGRSGVAAGIIPLSIQAMRHCGARVENIHIVMGPCALADCYEVPEEMAMEFMHEVNDSIDPMLMHGSGFSPVSTTRWNSRSIDLAATITLQLWSLGISHIMQPVACTICDKSYFSYRRDGITGRSMGIVWLE